MRTDHPTPQDFRDALELALRGNLTWLQRGMARASVVLGLIQIGAPSPEAVRLASQWLDEIEDAMAAERAPAMVTDDDYERESAMELESVLSAEAAIRRARKA